MTDKVLVAGVGMTPFVALGRGDASDLAISAVRMAVADAGLDFELIDQINVSCVQGGAVLGKQLLAALGLSGIGVTCVNEAGISGSVALQLAHHSLLAGEHECVLVVGSHALASEMSTSAAYPLPPHAQQQAEQARTTRRAPPASAGQQPTNELLAAQIHHVLSHLDVSETTLQRVLSNAHARARYNPYALLADPLQRDTRQPPYLAPPASGAAALLLCTASFARRYGLHAQVSCSSVLATVSPAAHEGACVLDVLGRAASQRLARQVYAQTGLGPEEIDVVELHDQSAADYLISTAALGFCHESELDAFGQQAHRRAPSGAVICPSGGLLGRGHAPGASALAQLVELVWQLRGSAGAHQVARARTALQHSTAAGRATALTLLQQLH